MLKKLIKVIMVLAIFGSGLLIGMSASNNYTAFAGPNGGRVAWKFDQHNYLFLYIYPCVPLKNVARASCYMNQKWVISS